MKSMVSKGIIYVKDNLNIEYAICEIEYNYFEDESFRYIFRPYYDVIDLLSVHVFQGIPGLDLSIRKGEFIRENRVPCFISERVPSENREDYYELLSSVGLEYMDPIEYLKRTKLKYSGDNLYVRKYEERKNIVLDDVIGKSNTLGIVKTIIDNVSKGNTISLKDGTVANEVTTYRTLLFLYEKMYLSNNEKKINGIEIAKQQGKYKGRKPISVDMLSFLEQCDLVKQEIITNKEAAKNLGISIDKYYRLKKQMNIS